MSRHTQGAIHFFLAILLALAARSAPAQTVCPEFSEVSVRFNCRFAGQYRTGQPYDFVTATPAGTGESFADAGMSIEVVARDCQGAAVAGIPAASIVLRSNGLCVCADGQGADGPTSSTGRTTFRQARLHAGGAAATLEVVVDGVVIGDVAVNVNGPAWKGSAWCAVDTDTKAYFAGVFGSELGNLGYGIESDFNEDGYIDLTDLALFARHLGEGCTPQTGVAAAGVRDGAPASHSSSGVEPPRIGIFFDSLGTLDCAELAVDEPVEYWILAFVEGSALDGITAAEFRVDGLPPSVTSLESRRLADVGLGAIDGSSLAWSACQRPENGVIPLVRGFLVASEPLPTTALRVTGRIRPSNDLFGCPLLTRCDIPSACDPDPVNSSKACAVGLTALVNPEPNPCTTATARRTWSQVKKLFR